MCKILHLEKPVVRLVIIIVAGAPTPRDCPRVGRQQPDHHSTAGSGVASREQRARVEPLPLLRAHSQKILSERERRDSAEWPTPASWSRGDIHLQERNCRGAVVGGRSERWQPPGRESAPRAMRWDAPAPPAPPATPHSKKVGAREIGGNLFYCDFATCCAPKATRFGVFWTPGLGVEVLEGEGAPGRVELAETDAFGQRPRSRPFYEQTFAERLTLGGSFVIWTWAWILILIIWDLINMRK